MSAATDFQKGKFDEAAAALAAGNWGRALILATDLIAQIPSHAGLCFIAGAASLELQQISQAIDFLSRATALDPTRADCPAQLARALVLAGRPSQALVAARRAWALLPRSPMTLETLGTSFSRLNQHALACEVFGRLVDLHPEHPAYRFNFATSLVFCGQVESAELQFVRCLELDPGFWKAYPALAKLRKQTPERNHLERFLAVLPDAGGDAAIYLHMALAKEYEDLGEYPIAFDHLALGKAIARKPKRYSFSRDQAVFEAVQSHFVPGPEGRGHPAREPIFVFGMPRSGTTLVERILSSHPDVRASGEREDFAIALKRASGSATPLMLDPDTVARSTNLDWRAVGRDYMASIGSRSGERFVDKLPQNFLYAGYIANALPLAKMICVRRNPMDTCLGNFRQLFPLASPYYDYSLDIGDIGRYYVMFDRLMSYWERLLPGRILSVQYETLVEEQESCTRAILDFCGLSWNEQCLRFERNASPVATASTLQVREPMNRESMNRWTLYRPQLESLRQLLGAAGIEVPG